MGLMAMGRDGWGLAAMGAMAEECNGWGLEAMGATAMLLYVVVGWMMARRWRRE